MLTLPHPRSGSCSCSRYLRSGSFLPLRNLLRMLRLLPFGCQLRKSYSRRDSWWLQLQRRCWYRSGRCHQRHCRRHRRWLLSPAATLLAASSSLNRGAPAKRRYFSFAGNTSQRAPLRNKEPHPPTAEEKICCRSKCSCCCSRVRSSAKSNSSFLFSLSFSSAAA